MRAYRRRMVAVLCILLLVVGPAGCRTAQRAWDHPVTRAAWDVGSYWGSVPGFVILVALVPLAVPFELVPAGSDWVDEATFPSVWCGAAGGAIVAAPFWLLLLPYAALTAPDEPDTRRPPRRGSKGGPKRIDGTPRNRTQSKKTGEPSGGPDRTTKE